MKAALVSSARHAATAAAASLGTIPFRPNADFGKEVLIALLAAGFGALIRFLTLIGKEE